MAVNLDESNFFKFMIVSDKPKPSKKNITEKPSKDKDNMTTKSSTAANNSENSMDEKKPKETNKQQSVPEVKVNDITSDNNEDSTEEQKNENKSSQNVQNSLSIKVPSKSASPQLVSSPSDLKPTSESISPTSPSQRSSKTDIFKNVGKKFGNMIKKDNGAQTKGSDTIPEQGDAVTSDSTVQMQQKQVVKDADNATPESIPEGVADSNNSTENTSNAAINNDVQKEDNDKKDTPQTAAAKQRTNSKFANVKLFLSRTSSVLVEKLEEKFDELDKRIYPDIDQDWVIENEAKLNRSREIVKSDESAIDEREQLLENKDISPVTNGTSQKAQSTHDILADVGDALNERQEKLDNLAESTEKLSNHTTSFLEVAVQLRKEQERKNKSWKFW